MLAREIEAQGGTARAASADVGDREALHAAVRELEAALGPVDVMVANAGLGVPTRSRSHQYRRRGGHVSRERAGCYLLDRGRAAWSAGTRAGAARG